MNDLINARCGWAGTDELYVKYHDEEWGKPVDDDRILFEFLVLESAQAGLSWITILRKREGYRKAFHRFDPERVAQMTPEEVDRLMRFDGIVRNRLKITAAINNAKLFRAIQKEFGSFYEYVLSFFPGRQPIVNDFKSLSQIPATSPESDAKAAGNRRPPEHNPPHDRHDRRGTIRTSGTDDHRVAEDLAHSFLAQYAQQIPLDVALQTAEQEAIGIVFVVEQHVADRSQRIGVVGHLVFERHPLFRRRCSAARSPHCP